MLTNELRRFCIGLSINGALHQSDESLDGVIEHEGAALSGKQAKMLLRGLLEKNPGLKMFTGTSCDNQNGEGSCLGHPVASEETAVALKCFCVADHDYYAARSPEEALELHVGISGEECRGDFDLSDVEAVSETDMDKQWVEEDAPTVPAGCLRDWLAEAQEPAWINSTEG